MEYARLYRVTIVQLIRLARSCGSDALAMEASKIIDTQLFRN